MGVVAVVTVGIGTATVVTGGVGTATEAGAVTPGSTTTGTGAGRWLARGPERRVDEVAISSTDVPAEAATAPGPAAVSATDELPAGEPGGVVDPAFGALPPVRAPRPWAGPPPARGAGT